MASQPEWKKVSGGNQRCQDCGSFVGTAWKLFEKPAVWTMCLCEACVEERISQ